MARGATEGAGAGTAAGGEDRKTGGGETGGGATGGMCVPRMGAYPAVPEVMRMCPVPRWGGGMPPCRGSASCPRARSSGSMWKLWIFQLSCGGEGGLVDQAGFMRNAVKRVMIWECWGRL